MNAQRQDILNILQSRGPLYTRELFDVMQDTYGYWGNVEAAKGCECLSKVLWDMKSKGQLHSRKENTNEGPKSQWGLYDFAELGKSDGEIYSASSALHAPKELHDAAKSAAQHIDTSLISSQYDNPDDDHISQSAEMVSDITELSAKVDDFAIDLQPSSHLLIMTDSKRILSGNNCEMKVQRATNQLHVCLSGDLEIHNRSELAQFIGAIERMLP